MIGAMWQFRMCEDSILGWSLYIYRLSASCRDYMGPTNPSWSVNKRLCKVSGEWPDKDVANASKIKVKKRKLSEVLDDRWTKEELKQFYNTFRKYGKNWKKVAGLIRNRSINMVESLYNLNRAYLSLPEGMATADGFLAMMTDHYSNLDGNDSDCERKGASVKTLKHLRCSRGKGRQDILKRSDGHLLQNQSPRSSYKCMSKKYLEGLFTDCWPRVVGKRTPRVPVIHNQGDGDNSVSNNKNVIKPAPDEDSYTAALTLIEASHGGGSLLVSQSPGRWELSRSSIEKHAEADMATSSDNNVRPDDNCLEGYSRRGEVDNGLFGGDTRILDGVNQSGAQCKDMMLQEMRQKGTKNWQFSDLGESLSHRGKRIKARKFKDKIDKEISEQRTVQSSQDLRAKSPLLFSEGSDPDPLQMLADVSCRIGLQASADESDPASCGGNQKRKNDFPYHPSELGALSANPETDNSKMSVQGDGGHSSFDAHKSNLPGSFKAICESVNSGISVCRNKEYSSTAAYKSKVHESLSADPESDNSKILVQGVQECPSIVRFADLPAKEVKLRKTKSPDKVSIQKAVPEAERGQIPEVEIHNDSYMDEHEKIEGDTIDASVKDKGVVNEEVAAAQNTTCNQPCIMESIQSMESEINVIADLRNAIVKQEGLLQELRQVNDVRTSGALTLDSKQHSDRVAKLLHEASNEVASAICNRRQSNTDNKSSIPPWFRSSKNSTEYSGPSDCLTDEYLISQDSGPHVREIVMNSRQKARSMVDATVLAMSTLKEGQDAFMRISENLDSSDNRPYEVDLNKLGTRNSCSYPSGNQNQAVSFTATVNVPKPEACFSSANEPEIPSGLISDCIATILMIQATSERRYPPADVTRILEDAVESLQPRCPQNLSVYRDIEKCMGYIKTQMLALVESPNASIPTKISV